LYQTEHTPSTLEQIDQATLTVVRTVHHGKIVMCSLVDPDNTEQMFDITWVLKYHFYCDNTCHNWPIVTDITL